jgi:ribose transport system substrate-binding protein
MWLSNPAGRENKRGRGYMIGNSKKRLLGAAAGIAASALIGTALARPVAAQVASLGDPTFVPLTSTLTKAGAFRKAPPYRIGIVLPGLFTTWLVQETEEVKHEASLHPEISHLTVAASESNAEGQAAEIEDMLTKGIDALIVAPVSPTAVNAEIDKAAAEGIPVIDFHTVASSDKIALSILQGGEPEGKVMGDWLVKQLKGQGSVWALRGIPGNSEDTDRFQGATDAFKGTKIQITTQGYAAWNYAKGKQLCEDLVLSGKSVDGIWSSGGEMSRGCLEVFQEVGKPMVPITGEANNGFLRAALASGAPFVAATYPASLGPVAVRAALALLEGKQLYTRYFGQSIAITAADARKYFRPDLNDSYWVQSTLPEATLERLYGKK